MGLSCPVDGSSCFADGVGELVLWRTQFGWSPRLTGPTTLNGISCPDALNCFGVGDSGTVIASVNGSPFSLQAYPTTQNLKGITCPNNQVCYGVGANGTIVTTTNAGGVWTVTSYNSTVKDLKGVSCPSSTICYAVGTGGTIVKYNNNANNQIWYPQASSNTKDLNGISCPSEILCFAVGAKGTIIATTDGSTWAAQPDLPDTITLSDFLSISCPSTQVCYAAGTKGRVVAAVHGPWTDQFNPTGRDLSGISCPTETTCFAVGNYGPAQFITTTDNGALWQVMNSSSRKFYCRSACNQLPFHQCLLCGRRYRHNCGSGKRSLDRTTQQHRFCSLRHQLYGCPNLHCCRAGRSDNFEAGSRCLVESKFRKYCLSGCSRLPGTLCKCWQLW